MDGPGKNPAAAPEPRLAPEPFSGSAHQTSQPSPPPQRTLSPKSEGHFDGWEAIGEHPDYYDVEDFLHPSPSLASEKLKDRKENDVVIFDYSLDPGYLRRVDGDPPVGGGRLSSGYPDTHDDLFFRVSKDRLMGSKQFDQIINPTKEPGLVQARAPRLAIIDFPQCYDTSGGNLLNSMAEKLGLPNANTFKDAHWKRVQKLPGCGGFKTGISLRVPFKSQSNLSGSGPSEDRLMLFVSFPYFGKSSREIRLGTESESIRLLDFKRLGAHSPSERPQVPRGDRTEIGEILVHQARYMIFDNNTMAVFGSKEDSAKDKVPLHHFQERTGAFRAMIHMIANRMDSGLSAARSLQASLCKLEEDIDQMISGARTHGGDQKTVPLKPEPARQSGDRTEVLTFLNRLSADLFAAISVAGRQIEILQGLYSVFSESYRTETSNRGEGSSLRRNLFPKGAAPITVPVGDPEQIWPNTLDAIDEAVQERKSFIKQIEKSIENMDIRRKILFGFLKSGHAGGAIDAVKRIEHTIRESQATLAEQDKALLGFTFVTIVFLPLNFCTSYFGMNNIKEFTKNPLSKIDFWNFALPFTTVTLLALILPITWKRGLAVEFRALVMELNLYPKRKRGDIENQSSSTLYLQEQTSSHSPGASQLLHPPISGSATPASGIQTPPQISTDPNPCPGSVARNSAPPGIQRQLLLQDSAAEPPVCPEGPGPRALVAPTLPKPLFLGPETKIQPVTAPPSAGSLRPPSPRPPSPQPQSPTGRHSTNPAGQASPTSTRDSDTASPPPPTVLEPNISALPAASGSSVSHTAYPGW